MSSICPNNSHLTIPHYSYTTLAIAILSPQCISNMSEFPLDSEIHSFSVKITFWCEICGAWQPGDGWQI